MKTTAAALLGLGFAARAIAQSAPASPSPNVVFILADDLGWSDLGCQGSTYYETPNIDRLAREGLRFTDAYAGAPNCAPTRACLMTGQYTPRHGIYTVGDGNRGDARYRKLNAVPNKITLESKYPTFAEFLRSTDVVTGFYGKWHLGETPAAGPAARGFTSALWWTDFTNFPDRAYYHFDTWPAVSYPRDQYLTDFLTDQGVAFLRQAQRQHRPFVLYLAHFAVHVPHEAPQDLIDNFARKPRSQIHGNPVYAAMLKKLDDSVGRIMAELDTLGLAENTLVIFTSDNGGVIKGRHPGDKNYVTSNAPLRGGKGELYEGGVRVPFIARWKGTILPGLTCAEPITSVDWVPTLLDLEHVTPPAGVPLDGVSWMPLFRASGKTALAPRDLYWHCPGYLQKDGAPGHWRCTPSDSIREGRWKLIESFEDHSVQLFNLEQDLGEKQDLASLEPAIAQRLQEKLRAWRTDLGAPMPTPNPAYVGPPAK